MGFSLLLYFFCTTLFSLSVTPGIKAGEDTCCSTGNGCCGPDWGLHCCNFVAKICCYGDQRVRALYHHSHHHWHWNRHWLYVTLYIILLMVLITVTVLCCKGHRRSGRSISEYTLLPGYDYSSPQHILPTAPVLQTFQTADEYPLMEYHKGQPRRNSLNAKQTAPPPHYEAA